MHIMAKVCVTIVSLATLSACGAFSPSSSQPSSAPPLSVTTPPTTSSLPPPAYDIQTCGVSTSADKKVSKVLLTIDDFPSEKGASGGELMITVADWARRSGVMMEAFPIKQKVDEYQKATGVDLVAELRKRGTYVSNHTYSHADLSQLANGDVLTQIRKGVKSTYLRPPYGAGAYTAQLQQLAKNEEYHLCTWNIDTKDWQRENGALPTASELVKRVHTQLMTIRTGSPVVILGHYYTNYPAALENIVREVKRMDNEVCPAPKGHTTENVPLPIC